MGRLTTTSSTPPGKPGTGIAVTVSGSTASAAVARTVTNHDGRCDKPLLEGAALEAGKLRDRVRRRRLLPRARASDLPSRRSSTRSRCASASPTGRTTTCRCWCRRGATPPTAAAEPGASPPPNQTDKQRTDHGSLPARLGQPAGALAAPDRRHRLDRRVLLLRDAGQLAQTPKSPDAKRGVFGELWAVHGGGFYCSQKFLTGPRGEPPHRGPPLVEVGGPPPGCRAWACWRSCTGSAPQAA